jgi:hypothetical protein
MADPDEDFLREMRSQVDGLLRDVDQVTANFEHTKRQLAEALRERDEARVERDSARRGLELEQGGAYRLRAALQRIADERDAAKRANEQSYSRASFELVRSERDEARAERDTLSRELDLAKSAMANAPALGAFERMHVVAYLEKHVVPAPSRAWFNSVINDIRRGLHVVDAGDSKDWELRRGKEPYEMIVDKPATTKPVERWAVWSKKRGDWAHTIGDDQTWRGWPTPEAARLAMVSYYGGWPDDYEIRECAHARIDDNLRAEKKKPVERWGVRNKALGHWMTVAEHRAVFAHEQDAKAAIQTVHLDPEAFEVKLLPLDDPRGQPLCPSCGRRYGTVHAMGCALVNVDDNGFGEEDGA